MKIMVLLSVVYVLLLGVPTQAEPQATQTPAQTPQTKTDEPTHVPFHATQRILWGDEISGKVHDSRYHGGTGLMYQIFGMEPGHVFRHSDRFSTLFLVDGIYYVLSGTFVVSNPETGEAILAHPGELAFLPRDSWNHGFAYGTEPLRVLEYLPLHGRGVIGREKMKGPVKYSQDQWLGRWPAASSEARRSATHRVVGDSDILWRMEGEKTQVLVGIMASTDQITFGKIILLPGQESEVRVHDGVNGMYVEKGEVHVRFPKAMLDQRGQTRWFDAKQEDGVQVPKGMPYQLYNPSKQTTTVVFGVAPSYLPPGAKP